ncbi:MAG TPA: hypothetical protein VLZ06_05885 [Solirubrobacteraceae bacterium]|nr:hypothetical protein [Solirubrobacteraceae bacterium]
MNTPPTPPTTPPTTPPARSRGALAATVLGVATLVLAGACGGSSAGRGGSDAPAPAPVGAGGRVAGAPCAIRPGSVCVTERARGHTLQLITGWTLTLRLGAPGRSFSVPVQSGPAALQALGRPRRTGTELVARYRAVRPGTVMLRATERPVCQPGKACPDYVSLWTLTVRVNRRP